MNLPSEFFATPLGHPEFRLAISLYHLSSRTLTVDATMEELSILTGMGQESLRRALRGLEDAGLVATTRTKRNFGKWSKNVYQLVLPSLENEVLPTSPPLENEGSTHGQVVPRELNSLSSTDNQVSNANNTSYYLVNAGGVNAKEKIVVSRWSPDDDDGIAGVGLFEDEIQDGKPKPKADKRQSKTRGQRPESEWTTNDIAAEFSHQLGRRFPYTPGLVNTSALRGALSKYRAQYSTTPEVEMELMRMFFEDDRNLKNADTEAHRIHGRYLNTFKTDLAKAYERLGLEHTSRLLNTDLDTPVVAAETQVEYIYASDGRRFANTVFGRRAMEAHEERKSNV